MILTVEHFQEGIPKALHTTYNAREMDLEFVDFHYLKSISLDGSAERIKQTITFRGTLVSQIEQICNRCLERTQNELATSFDLSYDVLGKETIDTTDDLRDILLLEHPDKFLCSDECRGICSQCGANLNRENCQCEKTLKKSNLFSQIKDFLDNKEN